MSSMIRCEQLLSAPAGVFTAAGRALTAVLLFPKIRPPADHDIETKDYEKEYQQVGGRSVSLVARLEHRRYEHRVENDGHGNDTMGEHDPRPPRFRKDSIPHVAGKQAAQQRGACKDERHGEQGEHDGEMQDDPQQLYRA